MSINSSSTVVEREISCLLSSRIGTYRCESRTVNPSLQSPISPSFHFPFRFGFLQSPDPEFIRRDHDLNLGVGASLRFVLSESSQLLLLSYEGSNLTAFWWLFDVLTNSWIKIELKLWILTILMNLMGRVNKVAVRRKSQAGESQALPPETEQRNVHFHSLRDRHCFFRKKFLEYKLSLSETFSEREGNPWAHPTSLSSTMRLRGGSEVKDFPSTRAWFFSCSCKTL